MSNQRYVHMKSKDFVSFCNKHKYKLVFAKDGSPNMKIRQNKEYFEFYKKVLKRNDYNENTEVKEFDCVICMETIKTNSCILDCGHKYCVVCFGHHMRENGNCPMCRQEIIKPPKKKEIMPSETISAMVLNEYLSTYNQRENLSLPNYIRAEINLVTDQNNINNERVCVNNIANEVYRFGHDIVHRVNTWHNNE